MQISRTIRTCYTSWQRQRPPVAARCQTRHFRELSPARQSPRRSATSSAMPTEPEWAALQEWLLGQIIGDGAPRGEKSATAGLDLHDVVRGSMSVLPDQRLAIYARSHARRLIECLREEFPTLRLFVGDQVFDLFAGAYIANRPSRSHSLYDLGAGFAEFLDATRPADLATRQSLE